eukprot:14023030-Alexandrium_andersonii.AAC.1
MPDELERRRCEGGRARASRAGHAYSGSGDGSGGSGRAARAVRRLASFAAPRVGSSSSAPGCRSSLHRDAGGEER